MSYLYLYLSALSTNAWFWSDIMYVISDGFHLKSKMASIGQLDNTHANAMAQKCSHIFTAVSEDIGQYFENREKNSESLQV